MFGNPVIGPIRPFPSPSDGTFRVTAPFGVLDPQHPTPHGGVDIGNAKCGDPIIACADGKVSMAGQVATALGPANVVRIAHPQYPGYETGYAHLATMTVKLGQSVLEGARIGTLGKTGASACHLHWGVKLNGVSVDGWPLLDQNQPPGDDMVQGTILARLTNRGTATHANTKFRRDPSTKNPEWAIIPGGTKLLPDFAVAGEVIPKPPAPGGTPQWFTAMHLVNGAMQRGYVHESTVGPLTPVEATDCTQAVADAVKPLNIAIAGQAARIAAAKTALG